MFLFLNYSITFYRGKNERLLAIDRMGMYTLHVQVEEMNLELISSFLQFQFSINILPWTSFQQDLKGKRQKKGICSYSNRNKMEGK